jgi:hypothetical protein
MAAKKSTYQTYGAQMMQDVFSDRVLSDLATNIMHRPSGATGIQDYYNQSDAYAVNGFLGGLGTNKKQKPPKTIKEKFDNNLDKKVKALNDKGSDLGANSQMNEGFTSIPRLMGILGQYVTPPSKITLAQMYEATLDATLGSILQVGKSLIISKVGNYFHENEKINKLINHTLCNLNETNLHYRGLDFLIYGFSVGEKSWGVTKDGYNYVDRITFAPPTNIEFMVDDYGKMNAALQPNLVASQYGIFSPTDLDSPESVFAIRQLIPNVLPYIMVEREDLFYTSYDSTFTPYGNSPMRRAYKWFELKNLAIEMFMTALSRNGVPTLSVYYQKDMAKNQEQLEELKSNADALSIGGAIYLPGRKGDAYEVDALRLDSSNIGVFLEFVEYCDKMMIRSLGFPQEILLGEGGSYSSGTIQKETYEDMLKLYTDTYVECLFEQIIKPVIDTNFSANIIKDNYGRFIPQLRETEKVEKAKLFEVAVNTGIVDAHSLADVNMFREALGLTAIESKAKLPINSLIKDQQAEFKLKEASKGTDVKGNINKPFERSNGKPTNGK